MEREVLEVPLLLVDLKEGDAWNENPVVSWAAKRATRAVEKALVDTIFQFNRLIHLSIECEY